MTRRGHLSFATSMVVTLALPVSAGAADMTKAQCIDANAKGQELRRDGKLAAAREQFRTCGDPSCPTMLRDDCTKRLDDLERAQPTIIFEAKDGAGNDLSTVKVTVDGLSLTERLAGAPVAVEPGEHTFTFEAAGQPTLQKKLVIRESEKDRRERVTLGTTDTMTPANSPLATPSGAPPASTPPPETSSGLGTQKILAIMAGGVGVVGIGLGSAFGLITISKKNDAQSACPNLCSSQDGVNKWSDAKDAATLSTVAFIVGGVALAGGAALWFTAPSSGGSSAQVGVGLGTVQLKGAW